MTRFTPTRFLLALIAFCLLPCLFAGRAGAQTIVSQNFDGVTPPALPSGWVSSGSTESIVTKALHPHSAPNSAASTSGGYAGLTYNVADTNSGNVTVSAWIYRSTSAEFILFARASGTNMNASTSYDVDIQDSGVQISKFVNGTNTAIATRAFANSMPSSNFYHVFLGVNGTTLKVWIQNNSGLWLNNSGVFQAGGTYCMTGTDTTVTGAGYPGFADYSSDNIDDYVESVYYDPTVTPATSYTANAIGGAIGMPITLVLSPNGATTDVVTITETGGAGASSPATVTLTGSTPVTTTFTPSASGTDTFAFTNTGTLTNPGGVTVGVSSLLADNSSVYWSPGNNYADTSHFIHLAPNGAYFKVGFTGTSFALVDDISAFRTYSIAAAVWPKMLVSVDGAYPSEVTLPDPGFSAPNFKTVLASGLAAGNHTLQAWYEVFDETDTYTPKDALKVGAIVLDNAASLLTPSGAIATFSDTAIVLGDSITQGAHATDPAGPSTSTGYPPANYAMVCGLALGCETGIVGLTGQGYTRSYNGWTQLFPNSFLNYDSTNVRVWPSSLKYLLLAEGTNDLTNNVTSASQAMIASARTAVGPIPWIIVVVPFAGMHRAELAAAVAAYKAAHSSDAKVLLIDASVILTTANTGTLFTTDGTHPNSLMHMRYGAILASLIKQATAPTGGTKRKTQ